MAHPVFHVKQGKAGPLTAAQMAQQIGLKPDQQDRLAAYVALLTRWNARINLVSPSSLADVWRRHILDSAQLYRLLPAGTRVLVDLGSGAGLPGLILAILGVAEVHLIESDLRKGAFLLEAARVTGIKIQLHQQRIEAVAPFAADIVTARALAPLSQLLDYAGAFLSPEGQCFFLKGARFAEELALARQTWHVTSTEYPSLSDSSGAILKLESIWRERDNGRDRG